MSTCVRSFIYEITFELNLSFLVAEGAVRGGQRLYNPNFDPVTGARGKPWWPFDLDPWGYTPSMGQLSSDTSRHWQTHFKLYNRYTGKLLSHYIWALTQIVYILPIRDSWLAHIINYEPNTLCWYISFMRLICVCPCCIALKTC